MEPSLAVLVVEDDPLVTSALTWLFEKQGYQFTSTGDLASATKALASRHFDVVLLDLYLPDGDGLGLLERALEIDPAPSVVMMTARADVKSAVDAIRRGATDFLEKPLDLDDLVMRLERVRANAVLKRKLAAYEAKEKKSLPIAKSAAMKEVLAIAQRVAATPSSSALLLGESGVGKEVVAARIHELSERRSGAFVRVNLAALPDNMVEAELFGSVRGAFTDAKRDRAGHFATADGGTILLDEVCEFKPELQPKLLRALEERRFFPLGSDREQRMNVRVLAATNKDPAAMIAKGALRDDLYYRLATVVIRIPPLRERREDIVPIAEHFVSTFCAEFGRLRCGINSEGERALIAHRWPGNVRELRNVIERAMMLSESEELGPDELGLPPADDASLEREQEESSPPAGASSPAPGDAAAPPTRLDEMERQHIVRMLALANGSRTRAATLLGISRSTLWEKGKRFGIF